VRRIVARDLGKCVPAQPLVQDEIDKWRPASAMSAYQPAGVADGERAKLGAQSACAPACCVRSKGVQNHAADAVS
jgi:hypothetical protein